MDLYQERVVAEKKELDERLAKLLGFFQTGLFESLPADERARLRSQARFMDGYSAVLGERIDAFQKPLPGTKPVTNDDFARALGRKNS